MPQPQRRKAGGRTPRKGKVKAFPRPAAALPDDLTQAQRLFVSYYLANGWNGVQAYFDSHPDAKSYQGACVNASKLLRSAKVRRALEDATAQRFKRLEMQGDEAVGLLSLSARADIGDAFDRVTGKPLAIHLWPESLRLAVKGIKPDGTVTLHDGLKARELLAVIQGRLRNTLDVSHTFDHAKYLAGETDKPGGTA